MIGNDASRFVYVHRDWPGHHCMARSPLHGHVHIHQYLYVLEYMYFTYLVLSYHAFVVFLLEHIDCGNCALD
jgi:hypothetical protein